MTGLDDILHDWKSSTTLLDSGASSKAKITPRSRIRKALARARDGGGGGGGSSGGSGSGVGLLQADGTYYSSQTSLLSSSSPRSGRSTRRGFTVGDYSYGSIDGMGDTGFQQQQQQQQQRRQQQQQPLTPVHHAASTGNLNQFGRQPDERAGMIRHSSLMGISRDVSGNKGVGGGGSGIGSSSSTNNGRPSPPSRKSSGLDVSAKGTNQEERKSDSPDSPSDGGGDPESGPPVVRPSVVGKFSRRKAPIAPACRYLMEVMCTDLVACGECYVPDNRNGQTLVRFCSFVPIGVDEALDGETSRFMEESGGEAYGRGVGLPGLAWSIQRTSVVTISSLTSDLSFDSGGKR